MLKQQNGIVGVDLSRAVDIGSFEWVGLGSTEKEIEQNPDRVGEVYRTVSVYLTAHEEPLRKLSSPSSLQMRPSFALNPRSE